MKFYRNGNYVVCIKDDGTKIRRTDGDEFIPQFDREMIRLSGFEW